LKTTTDRLIEEATERDNERPTNYIHAILERWTCSRKGCRNHAKHCFVDSINGGKHLPIDSDDVRNWNIDIPSEKATIEIPSDRVRASMLSKSEQHQKHSEKGKVRPQQEPTIIINNHIHLNSPRRTYRNVPYSNNEENVEFSPHRMSMKSSPISSDSDPDASIDAYINWHIKKTPTHEEFLSDAKVKLLGQGMTMKMLRKLERQDYKSIDVPMGVGMRLTEEIKIYKQDKKKSQS
jgi:hypothetical protein